MITLNSRTSSFLLILLTFIFLSGCAHKKAYKQALELEKAGRYVDAAEKDLLALDKKSDFSDAREHLQLIAPKAYQELFTKSGNFERNSMWLDAIESWKHLDIMLTRMQRHNIHVTAEDIRSRITRAQQNGTSFYYAVAQQNFNSRQYEEAVTNYNNVIKISGNYLDSRQKLWESLIRLGDQKLRAADYPAAVQYYQASLDYTNDKNTSNQFIAGAYYQWADYFMRESNYREATEKFESVLQVDPSYRDARQRREDAFQKAVRRIAILPFHNISSNSTDKYCNLLTDYVLNNCIKANLKYAIFINRANLDLILEEHKLAMSGVLDAGKATEIGRLEGIHYFGTGNITQITPQNVRPSFVKKTFDKIITLKDSAGNDIQQRESREYLEYSSSRSVRIAVSFQMVEVETGRYILGENFTTEARDDVTWIRYDGNISDLPQDKQELVKRTAEPKPAEVLLTNALRKTSDDIGEKLVRLFQ